MAGALALASVFCGSQLRAGEALNWSSTHRWKPSGPAHTVTAAANETASRALVVSGGLKWRPIRPARHSAAPIATQVSPRHGASTADYQVTERFDPFEDDAVAGPQPPQDTLPDEPSSKAPQSKARSSVAPRELPPPSMSPMAQDEANSLAADRRNCEEELERLRANRVTGIGLSIRVKGKEGDDFPLECSIGNDSFSPRAWHDTLFTWKASSLCHKPLYFEDAQLERYGHDWGPFLQPVVSGAHFFATLPILPYKMGLKPPNECIYALGYYRPGNCAPYMIEPLGFSPRAALFETGAVLGAVFIIP